jgi:hypothetical protein
MPTNGSANHTLADLVERLTDELGGVSTRQVGGATDVARGPSIFAAVRGSRVSLRLRPDIAEAALRTPRTSPSTRGPEWIEFEPDTDDPQDVDRLRAWLTIGWRTAQRQN